jgi:ankyrin repeat protein
VESGHFQLALRLVELGADPNDQRSGFTPLHALTWVRRTERGDSPAGDPPPRGSGNVTSLQFAGRLVAMGADVNTRLQRGQKKKAKLTHEGATPYLLAAKNADLPLMKLFVELGADPMLTNVDGTNALMAAAGIGVVAVGEEPGTEPEVLAAAAYLLDFGFDINHKDDNGETAMHGAAYRLYPRVVEFLAAHGADPQVWDAKNNYGWTPTMIAHGKRPGSLKPSPETIAALAAARSDAQAASVAE